MAPEKVILGTTVVVGSLVQNLSDIFDSASDLYRRLRKKQDRESGRLGRRRSFREYESRRSSRRFSDDGRRSFDNIGLRSESDEESINSAGSVVRREYEHGYLRLGETFAAGDVITQNQLQAQIILLQGTLISIYESTTLPNPPPIPHHLHRLATSARSARDGALAALNAQYSRQLTSPVTLQLALPAAAAAVAPATTTITATDPDIPRPRSRDSDAVTTISGPTSIDTHAQRHRLYCLYALDLQDHATQPLSDTFQPGGSNRCPYCGAVVPTTVGKSWEIVKEDRGKYGSGDSGVSGPFGRDRVFHIDNRFLVKAHRPGRGFACVLCSRERDADTVMGDVRALVDHVWREHDVEEYERERDMMELLVREGAFAGGP